MVNPLSAARPVPRLALQCSAGSPLATPALLGWRERLLRALNQVRWWRASSAVDALPAGYEALDRLDEHLLADIGAPESLRERARQCRELQRLRVIDLEHGHRPIGEGRW